MYVSIKRENENLRHYWASRLTHIVRLYSEDKKESLRIELLDPKSFNLLSDDGSVFARGSVENTLSFS